MQLGKLSVCVIKSAFGTKLSVSDCLVLIPQFGSEIPSQSFQRLFRPVAGAHRALGQSAQLVPASEYGPGVLPQDPDIFHFSLGEKKFSKTIDYAQLRTDNLVQKT